MNLFSAGNLLPVQVYFASNSYATIEPSSSSKVIKASTGFTKELNYVFFTTEIFDSTSLILS
jgi:hypothetical protein